MAATPARRRCVRRLRQLHDSLASAAADGYDGPLPPPGMEGQRGSSSALSEGELALDSEAMTRATLFAALYAVFAARGALAWHRGAARTFVSMSSPAPPRII